MRRGIAALLAVSVSACTNPAAGPSPATRVEVSAGAGQTGSPGFELRDSVEVRVVDAQGDPVAGAVVRWAAQDRDATIAPATTTTDAQGLARAAWRLGRDDGLQVVTATFSNLPAARVEAQARSGTVTQAGGSLEHQCGKFSDEVVRCWSTPADGPAAAVALETDLRFAALGFASDRWCGSARGGVIACVIASELSPGGVFRPDAAPVHVVATGVPEFARVVGSGDPETGLTWCGQALDQSVWCWGRNASGQLGGGTVGGSSDAPVQVVGGLRAISIAVTREAACAIDVQGVAWCWGASEHGVVAGGAPSATPVAVPTPRRFFQVAGDGTGAMCAIDAGDLVYCWGSNANGGRGRNGTEVSSVPTAIEGTDFYVSVTGADDGFLALTVDRTLVTWGGLSGTPFGSSPVRILSGYVFGEILPGGGRGVVCVRAYPDGTRCVDRLGLVHALTTTPAAHLIYGVPEQ